MYLKDIYIYPIKSLGGIRLEESILEERGLKFDRRWMLVDKEGMFLTQRTFPEMALLQVEVGDSGLLVYHKNDHSHRILVPFQPQTNYFLSVTIWDDVVIGQKVDQQVSKWFSETLDRECDLVIMPESTERKLSPKYAVNSESVGFADAMPYLLIGQTSLDELNGRLEVPVPMDRFRPNLVFAGGNPFEDDTWDKVQVGEAVFKITKPCARCVMTTVNQVTAEKSKEPLKTLATYRTFDHKVMFGQNMLLLSGDKIKVGDEVVPFLK
ncbi:MOSC domain-containing protein [Cognataquiflexum rubidum]|uniref:MOSC domain-containing protein n=1 Tax=Cognataquiflexum rubidum TaxID=2922273 RepID=UPI001F13F954|nr:MOSC N-terminal beta barrel domain-containing protein [Cognataquiflexum rubidum]MCH6234665.1 MOSC domain-containing protein [Cognataquiflexum rubidum]